MIIRLSETEQEFLDEIKRTSMSPKGSDISIESLLFKTLKNYEATLVQVKRTFNLVEELNLRGKIQDEIMKFNKSATVTFLGQFSYEDLLAYYCRLCELNGCKCKFQ